MIRTCEYCSTAFEVPDDASATIERTADMPPPADVMVWASAPEARIPDFAHDPVLHRCKKGRPACVRCGAIGQVGNALLGLPPAPLICLNCSKAAAHTRLSPAEDATARDSGDDHHS